MVVVIVVIVVDGLVCCVDCFVVLMCVCWCELGCFDCIGCVCGVVVVVQVFGVGSGLCCI